MTNYSINRGSSSSSRLRKVPEIILLFWVIKLLTTAMGEATSDFLVYRYNRYIAVAIGGTIFLITLIIQLRTKKYNAWAYWLAVSMVAVFGTMAADGLHIKLGVPYKYSTIFFAVALAVIFILWKTSEKTLSIHSIFTLKRELFYWATVLATFALGTAAGDLTAKTAGLGYFSSGLMFAGIIAVPAILYYVFKINEVFCFWFAYVITRPLGASFADWIGKPKSIGGLGWGDGRVSIYLTIIILILVAYLSISKADVKKTQAS